LEGGRLIRQARAVGADLQHGRTPIDQPTADNARHAPARNEAAEVKLPTLRKNAQNSGQLVKPCADLWPEAPDEPPTDSSGDPGRGRAHCADRSAAGIWRCQVCRSFGSAP